MRPDGDPRGPGIVPMQADHGPDCGAPPATHPVGALPAAVFVCRDHLMTAMNAGYGAWYLTPNVLMDWTSGEAVLRFDMSTLRHSDRDWTEVLLTPFQDNLQLPFAPNDHSTPRNALRVEMINGPANTGFKVTSYVDGVERVVPTDTFLNWNSFLTPDAARRDTFELHVSQTHVRFGMPGYNRWWTDTDVPAFGWTRAVVQLNHYSYNPLKACDFDGTCGPTTWHWDSVGITPATPFVMIHTDREIADALAPDLTLAQPAPTGAFLRFTAAGRDIQFSTDNGTTWRPANPQVPAGTTPSGDELEPYWTPLPQGAQRLLFRGQPGAYGWLVRDATVWAETTQEVPPSTPVPALPPTLPIPTSLPSSTPSTAPSSPTATLMPPTPTGVTTATPSATPSPFPSTPTPLPVATTPAPSATASPPPPALDVPCTLVDRVLTCVLP